MASNPLPHANQNWLPHTPYLVNANGNPLPPTPPVGGINNLGGTPPPGGDIVSDVAGLKKNVAFLNWVAAGGVLALLFLYFQLSGDIKSESAKAISKIERVSEQIADLRVAVASSDSEAKPTPENHNAPKPETSPSAEPAKPVR